ncbi:hypothetical protein, partial [Streptomyces cacaoi]|uniref:hypothetical protein n=1 Tax=Streptomyces cacaoi TaxID=1898 RepID=UPI0037493F07
MAFSHRIATLAAVVAIPLGIAVTSYALTDSPDPAQPPAKVELDDRSPSPGSSGPGGEPSGTPSSSSGGEETVPRPPATGDGADDGPGAPADDGDDGRGDGKDD